MSMSRKALWLLVALLMMAMAAPAGALDTPNPQVVVAVADTGVNPYHEVYYRPQNTAHPCTWVVGFDDCSIPALPLSVGQYADQAAALAADADLWASVQPHQWYWIPRTNIIGAVCDVPADASEVCILDDLGHGTGTTSSVISEEPDALLLVHDGNGAATNLASAPVLPDIQSHSWGPVLGAPLPLHVVEPVVPGHPHFCGRRPWDAETVFFLAAGNETPNPALLDCDRVFTYAQVIGGAYPGTVDWGSRSTYDFASWMCRPTARFDHVSALGNQCGTSFSAPTAAGAAAAALLEIRRQDGYTGRSTADHVSTSVTREGFIEALRAGATYTPESKYPNRPAGLYDVPLPQQAPYLFWGYGWLDSTVSDEVVACALGQLCAAKSAEAQEYNARRQDLRAATTEDALPSEPQDDAGSGRDAGPTRRTSVAIEPGLEYSGRLDSYVTSGDETDLYPTSANAWPPSESAFLIGLTAGNEAWPVMDLLRA
jgi:hypothetical protein